MGCAVLRRCPFTLSGTRTGTAAGSESVNGTKDNRVFPIPIWIFSLNSTKLKLCKTYLLHNVVIKVLFPLANYKELSVLKDYNITLL